MDRCFSTPMSHGRVIWLPPLVVFLLFSLPSSFLARNSRIGAPPGTPPLYNGTRANTSLTPIVPVTTNPGTKWSTDDNITAANETTGWSVVPALLLQRPDEGPSFACGLLCLGRNRKDNTTTTTSPCQDSILFGIFLVVVNSSSNITTHAGRPVVVWSANRNKPLRGSAMLSFTASGNLQLEDERGDSAPIWSSNTTASDIAGMNLTREGNLILYNRSNGVVWQSFDHPTDTALPGQSLTGKRLVTRYFSKGSSESVRFLLVVSSSTYSSFVEVDHSPPQIYYSNSSRIQDGVLLRECPRRRASTCDHFAKIFARLETTGRLIKCEWSDPERAWKPMGNLSQEGDYREACANPIVCMTYGYCVEAGECSCPRPSETSDKRYFERVNDSKPTLGCKEMAPLSCKDERLVDFGNIDFYGYRGKADIEGTDIESCKGNCSKNCSCKGAFFKYGTNASNGECYLPSLVLSLTQNKWKESGFNSTAFLKVQIPSNATSEDSGRAEDSRGLVIAVATAVSFCFVVACICSAAVLILNRRKRRRRRRRGHQQNEEEEDEEVEFTHLPGMPTRFTYVELASATGNFSTKLGEGGFGAVFLGTLQRDGSTRIAVKVLGHRGQGMKEFLAEVQTIGSIHHVNLVRLIGYCADRFHRLLVYEFLSKGSLDGWIFECGETPTLDWPIKRRIVLDVARGLSYLHEECRQRIIHLDIKPQNILLDAKFNAKVSDFGLSKLMEKDQSQVVTTLRGTPGYIAPEWLSSTITEKVDVYSFGVVVLEMVSGKRVLDNTRSQGKVNLLGMLKKAAKEDRLLDMVGGEYRGEEAVEMVRIAMWCLQGDYSKRPPMSSVVKALEGVVDVEVLDLDYNFWVPTMGAAGNSTEGGSQPCGSTPLLASVVSGPR